MNGLRDFWEFLRAIWESSIGFLSGGIGIWLTVLGFWTTWLPKHIFIGGGIVSIVISTFTAFRAERSAARVQESKHREQSNADKRTIAELKAKVAALEKPVVDPLLADRRESFAREVRKIRHLHPQSLEQLRELIIARGGVMSLTNLETMNHSNLLVQTEGRILKIRDGFKDVADEWVAGVFKIDW